MHDANFLSSWLREDVEGVKAEMHRLSVETNKEDIRIWKREVEEERGGVEKKNNCLEHLPSQNVGEHCSVPDVESAGNSSGSSRSVICRCPCLM